MPVALFAWVGHARLVRRHLRGPDDGRRGDAAPISLVAIASIPVSFVAGSRTPATCARASPTSCASPARAPTAASGPSRSRAPCATPRCGSTGGTRSTAGTPMPRGEPLESDPAGQRGPAQPAAGRVADRHSDRAHPPRQGAHRQHAPARRRLERTAPLGRQRAAALRDRAHPRTGARSRGAASSRRGDEGPAPARARPARRGAAAPRLARHAAEARRQPGPRPAASSRSASNSTARSPCSTAALKELRELAHGIHPSLLTSGGLALAVPELAGRCPVPVVVDVQAEGRLPAVVESTAYFVVAEALANIAKHSKATRAWVRAHLDERRRARPRRARQRRGRRLAGGQRHARHLRPRRRRRRHDHHREPAGRRHDHHRADPARGSRVYRQRGCQVRLRGASGRPRGRCGSRRRRRRRAAACPRGRSATGRVGMPASAGDRPRG